MLRLLATNTSLCLHPDAFVYSQGKKNWTTWARQKKRHLAAGTAYKPQHQVLLGLLSLSHVFHYLLLLLLLLIGVKAAFFGWLVRILILQFMYRKVFSVLQERGVLLYIPIFDALLAMYYGTFVPIQLITRSNVVGEKDKFLEYKKSRPPSMLATWYSAYRYR